MRRIFPLVVLLAVTLVASGCTRDQGPTRGVVPVDQPMPSFDGETLDGDTFSSDELAGAPAVVNVWATWCGPCQAELPALVATAERFDGRVGFVGVDYVDDASAARAWQSDYGIPYPSVDDRAGALADDLGFPYLPHTLVVDASGTIRYRIFGETTEAELSDLLEELLAGASAT